MTRVNQPGLVLQDGVSLLRTLSPEDIDDSVAAWFSDDETMRYISLPMNLSTSSIKRSLTRFDNYTSMCIGIFDQESNRVIGMYLLSRDIINKKVRMRGLIGSKAHRGTDIMHNTRRMLLDHLFDEFRVNKVWSAVFARNLAAVFSYRTQGFHCEGVLRQDIRDRDGELTDIVRFAMLREDWIRLRAQDRDQSENQTGVSDGI